MLTIPKDALRAMPSNFVPLLIVLVAILVIAKSVKERHIENKMTRALAHVNGQPSAVVLMSANCRAGIAINREATAISLAGGNWINIEVFKPSEVLSAELYIDGECETRTSRTSQAAGALVGGLLLGGVGVVVGGLTGKTKSRRMVSSIVLRVMVNDTDNPLHEVSLLAREQPRESPQVQKLIDNARTFQAKIDLMIKRADREDQAADRREVPENRMNSIGTPALSIADGLRKLVELKNSGELSDAEYQPLRSRLIA
jgi:hypothetical protein